MREYQYRHSVEERVYGCRQYTPEMLDIVERTTGMRIPNELYVKAIWRDEYKKVGETL